MRTKLVTFTMRDGVLTEEAVTIAASSAPLFEYSSDSAAGSAD